MKNKHRTFETEPWQTVLYEYHHVLVQAHSYCIFYICFLKLHFPPKAGVSLAYDKFN